MTTETKDAPVARIHDNAVYSLGSARRALRLADSCLRREIRLGRLRVSKRAGRYFILGKWLIEWIEGGERRKESDAE
jgi:hypothetical protein